MHPALGLVIPLPLEAIALLGRGAARLRGEEPVFRSRARDGTELVSAISGVGCGNARSAARRLVESGGATALAVLGVSGGIAPGLGAGFLVVGDGVVEETGDACPPIRADGPCAEFALASLAAGGFAACRGGIVTAAHAVLSPESKRSLHERTGALAVDMESAGVGRVAAATGLPFFALRSICDPSGRGVPPDLPGFLGDDGRVRPGVLLRNLRTRPSLLVDLLRAGKDLAVALSSLRGGWGVLERQGLPSRLASGR